MTVIENPLLLRKKAAAAEAYQIEKSIRFNEADSAHLLRTTGSKGNRRIWTWAAWVKRWDVENRSTLFSAGDGQSDTGWTAIEIETDEKLKVTGWNTSWKQTNRLFRDPGAWFHIVVAFDTTQATATDRCKVYINGKLETSFSADNSLTQNTEYAVNEGSKPHRIGGIDPAGVNNAMSNFYLADNYLIDGLALSPAAFGEFDSARNWNPKAFAIPAPNNGTTWSDNVTCNATLPGSGADSAAEGFDGDSGTAYPNVTRMNTFTSSSHLTVSFGSSGIPCSQAVEIPYTLGSGSIIANYDVTFKDGHVERRSIKGPSGSGASGTFTYNGRGSNVTEFKITTGSSSANGVGFGHIKIDGVELVDGQTDETDRTKLWPGVNTGVKWSSYLTATNGSLEADGHSQGPDKAFDGDESTYSQLTSSSNPNTQTFTPPGGIAYTSKVEIYIINAQNTASLNGGSAQSLSANAWNTIATGSGTINTIAVTRANANGCSFNGIRVDGVVLINSIVDNSFHLKFNDSSLNRYLGKDTLNGKIADATGGLPIYNTTDDYGDVKDTGYRNDSSSSSLIFALPGDTTTDIHHSVKGSGSAKTITNSYGTITTSSAQSRFYGTSLDYTSNPGNGASTSTIGQTVTHSDFDVGTGDFTIEFWCMNPTWDGGSTNKDQKVVALNNSSSYSLWYVVNGVWKLWMGSDESVGYTFPSNQWVHTAISRSGTSLRCFANGVLVYTKTTSHDFDSGSLMIGGSGSNSYTGYIQGLRVYTSAKYTADFKPPTRNDFTVNNIISESAVYSANVSASNSIYQGDGNKYKAFDGSASTWVYQNGGGASITWDASDWDINVTSSLKIQQFAGGSNATYTIDINGTQVKSINVPSGNFAPSINVELADTTTKPFKLNELKVTGGQAGFNQIIVDGTVLVDVPKTAIDVSTDTPTNYTDDSDVAHGNYCTLNPLTQANNSGTQTFGDGNLYHESTSSAGAWHMFRGTMAIPKGSTDKFYYEVTWLQDTSNTDIQVGWVDPYQKGVTASGFGDNPHEYCFRGDNGKKFNANTQTTYGSAPSQGDVVGVGYDNGSIRFWVNGTEQDSGTAAWTGISKPLMPGFATYTQSSDTCKVDFNFGQLPFKHPQSGYKGICTENLNDTFADEAAGIVNNPSAFFDATTWVGNDSSPRTITQANGDFTPDLIWLKNVTTNGRSHYLYDVVRTFAVNKELITNDNHEEGSSGQATNESGYVSGVGTGEFTVGAGSVNQEYTNKDGDDFVAFTWDAGTAAVTPSSSYNITPTAQWVNNTAGFSITGYTGNGSDDQTLPHGLNAKPHFVFVKNRDSSNASPQVKHHLLSAGKVLFMHTNAQEGDSGYGEIKDLDSNVTVTLDDTGNDAANVNKNNEKYIMYAWTGITGYSEFGTYTGNNSADGPFEFCGFRPKWLLIKNRGSTTNWQLFDAARDKYNVTENWLEPNQNNQEQIHANVKVDFLSNGFKLRGTDGGINAVSDYVYAAFAEHPQKTSRAR